MKLAANDVKSCLFTSSSAPAVEIKISKGFSFYDISRFENFDIETKKTMLFGSKKSLVLEGKLKTDNISKPGTRTPEITTEYLKEVLNITSPIQEAYETSNDEEFSNKKKRTKKVEDLPRFIGYVKMFFEKEGYGFLKSPQCPDVYVRYEDLKLAGVDYKFIVKQRHKPLSFNVENYLLRGKPSRRAMNIKREDKKN